MGPGGFGRRREYHHVGCGYYREYYVRYDKGGISPVEHGVVVNWDCMENIWQHAFSNELHVAPENLPDHPVLLTEAPMNPKGNRQKTTELMFETFNFPAMYLGVQAVLSLYSSGRTTGVVLDSGGSVTHSVPIYEGHWLPHAALAADVGGDDVTNWLTELLVGNGKIPPQGERDWHDVAAISRHERERGIFRDITARLCYVAADYDEEVRLASSGGALEGCYTLPDGSLLSVGSERFRCPEALFDFTANPDAPTCSIRGSGGGASARGIHEMVYASIMRCDADLHKSLYGNIVLAGGTTMLDGIAGRLSKEVAQLAAQPRAAGPERRFAKVTDSWVAYTKEEFVEHYGENEWDAAPPASPRGEAAQRPRGPASSGPDRAPGAAAASRAGGGQRGRGSAGAYLVYVRTPTAAAPVPVTVGRDWSVADLLRASGAAGLSFGGAKLDPAASLADSNVTAQAMLDATSHVNVVAPPERKYSAWKGGSILSSLPSFLNMCMLNEEYDEYGPNIAHKKFF